MKVRTIAMFLYDNTIVSENQLVVDTIPENFVEEAISYNKELLQGYLTATTEMIELINAHDGMDNVVTEAFDDFMDRVLAFLREFKAKVIVLFRRWVDWISKKLSGVGRYRIEAAKALFKDATKCRNLAGFRFELTEPTDFGFTYFQELDKPNFPYQVIDKAIEINANCRKGKDFDQDAQKMRDHFQRETNSYLNGSKMTEVTIRDLENIVGLLDNADKKLAKYKNTITDAISAIEKEAKTLKKLGLTCGKAASNAMLVLVTCLNEHLTAMSSNFAAFVNRITTITAEFLPRAEEYLIAQDN